MRDLAQCCPMPYALCPMPYARCRVPCVWRLWWVNDPPYKGVSRSQIPGSTCPMQRSAKKPRCAVAQRGVSS